MNPETFLEWMRRQGRRVYKTTSSYWYEAGARVLQAFPYNWLICPTPDEIHDLMTEKGILSLRYSTPLGFPDGKISYHIVLHHPYRMDILKAQTRNGIKRGMSHFKLEQVSFERMTKEGWVLQQDTLDRQNRLRSMTQAEWERICRSAVDLPGIEAWAATSDGELAGAVIVCRVDDIWYVPYALSHRRFLGDHVNNALFYGVSCDLLSRDRVKEIFFTVQSLDAPPKVDDFKLRMGLIPRAVRQRVVFHPWLQPFATTTTHKLFQYLLKHDDASPFIAKAEGMLRFHMEGKQPLMLQKWPECLMPCKEEILNSAGG